MRLRICSAKCGVEAPMSWRTSSTVGSRRSRSLRSYSLMGAKSTKRRLGRVRLHGDQLRELVHMRLLLNGDRLVVAEHPGAVVDRLPRVVLVSRLHAEEVLLELWRERLGVIAQEQRCEHAARGERGGRGGVRRPRRAGDREVVAR